MERLGADSSRDVVVAARKLCDRSTLQRLTFGDVASCTPCGSPWTQLAATDHFIQPKPLVRGNGVQRDLLQARVLNQEALGEP